jgi:DNA topoisomerase-1
LFLSCPTSAPLVLNSVRSGQIDFVKAATVLEQEAAESHREPDLAVEPPPSVREEIEEADLVYLIDTVPGIRRLPHRDSFHYVDAEGKPVREPAVLARIKSLAIPPAWKNVWISPLSNGHLQATGRDAKGRKQYRYHARWREVRDRTKYERMIEFGEALPRIRRQVEADLAKRGMPREKVLATVVRLLETTLIRVGNEKYEKANNSFGLTTMRNRHVKVEGSRLRFDFVGKSGKKHSVGIRDRRLARIIRQCQEIKGQELFQYLDEDGARHAIDSADVNAYLKEISGDDFTAKDYRTWAGTVLAALTLSELDSFESATQAKKNLARAAEAVSRQLGNTAAICRKCYIHPDVIEGYLQGALVETLKQRAEAELLEAAEGLAPDEAAVLGLLRQRLQRRLEEQSHAA